MPAARLGGGYRGVRLERQGGGGGVDGSVTERLTSMLAIPDEAFDLAEAALLIAKDEYPELDVERYLARFDELADGARQRLSGDPGAGIAQLNDFLFREQGFRGNGDDYYDPRNSYLSDVLDRKLGIPISLSILYLEVGQRLGLPLMGVSFPGHFLVRAISEDGTRILDPYDGGVELAEEVLRERLERVYQADTASEPDLSRWLVPASKREILLRVLRNLKGIYLHHQTLNKALMVVHRIMLIVPDNADELRDRARIYERLECFRAAADDYERYLQIAGAASDARDIYTRMADLRRRGARLN